MFENNHISQEQMLKFQQNQMNPQEKIKLLEHISSCNYCAGHFAEAMSGEILPAPKDLKSNILSAVKRPEVQIARRVNETSKRMQLLWYSLKVTTATAGALAVLFLALNFGSNISEVKSQPADITNENASDKEEGPSLADQIKSRMNSFGNIIVDFSNNIIQSEVNDHDKKEK